ncbi:MAG: acyltransferase [Pseudomonadota bacterium]
MPPAEDQRFASYVGTRRFGSLDGLRCLCILPVLWHHWPAWRELVDGGPIIFSRGHVGVDFFFVLSGFLITTLLLREEARTGSISLVGFYWRRALRILPIYFLVVTVAAIYSIGIKGRTEDLEILPYYYLFLSNFIDGREITFLGPTWSLAVEEQYYLIWPAILIFLPRRWLGPVLCALIAVNVLAVFGFWGLFGITGFAIGPLYFGLKGATYAPILIGSLLALVLSNPRGFSTLWPATGFRLAPLLWLGLILVVLGGTDGKLEGLPNLFLHSFMALMLCSLVVREDNALAPVLRLRPIARVGEVSYGIYLYHLFALAVVGAVFEALGLRLGASALVLYAALSFLIAEISFRTFERFFREMRPLYRSKPAARSGPPAE